MLTLFELAAERCRFDALFHQIDLFKRWPRPWFFEWLARLQIQFIFRISLFFCIGTNARNPNAVAKGITCQRGHNLVSLWPSRCQNLQECSTSREDFDIFNDWWKRCAQNRNVKRSRLSWKTQQVPWRECLQPGLPFRRSIITSLALCCSFRFSSHQKATTVWGNNFSLEASLRSLIDASDGRKTGESLPVTSNRSLIDSHSVRHLTKRWSELCCTKTLLSKQNSYAGYL